MKINKYSKLLSVVWLTLSSLQVWGNINDAQWISVCQDCKGDGMPIFRKSIPLRKKVSHLTIQSSALGVYELFVNGRRMGDDQLMPGWTDYRKEIPFVTHQLSTFRADSLCLVAYVSRGWWTGDISREVYGKNNRNAFILCADIHYADGTEEQCMTDLTWQCATNGALVMGDIYNGETYDGRRKGHEEWQPVSLNTDEKGTLIPFEGPKVKIRDKKLWRYPQRITVYQGTKDNGTRYGEINTVFHQNNLRRPVTLKKGQTVVIDLGQNMVGWINFKVKGQEGTLLTWRFAEMLNSTGDERRLDKGPAGSVWTYNLRKAEATLRYTLTTTNQVEEFHPTHTFFGFRYVELTATEDVTLLDLVGQVVGSDIREWGTFECSNPDINQLYQNIWWGQRGNFLSIPTDCPQRDERLGWTGDTQIFSIAALYNSDAKDFYRKWMRDMRNSQREDGAYPCTAPHSNMWGYGGAAWGDAGIIVPWNVYMMTADKQILEENYRSMQAWLQHCIDQKEEGWQYVGAETDFGDWLAYREVEKRYVAYAYFAYSTTLMQKTATLLGYKEDATRYAELLRRIKEEFQKRYVTNGTINTGKDTQTAYLLALHFDLLQPEQRPAAVESLRQNIIANGYKLSTGFVGTGILMETLTENGLTDLAYRLLLQRENPSWLYSIDQGATTIWERWDSYTRESGFNKHKWNMNSFNHYSYGAVAGWFYSTILGIRPDEKEPGFRYIILRPQPGGALTWAKGGTSTPYGEIHAEWKQRRDGSYEYHVTIPQGTTATLYNNGTSVDLKPGTHKCILF